MVNRTVLIGLDGATFSILDPLMEEGIMPSLRALVASGTRAELLSVIPPLTPPAWTSLMTGRNPGHHGVFDFFRFEFQDGQYLRVVGSGDVGCETIWSMVTRRGLKATVLNFPMMFPPRPISGCIVPGWVPWRHLRPACYPSGLYERLQKLPGFDARKLAMNTTMEGEAIEGSQREEDYETWIQHHIWREQQWFKILCYLMREDPSHLTAIVFDGVDKLQHVCWRFLDPRRLVSTPSAWELKIRALCLDYFRQLDRFLAEIILLAGADATIALVSDHGFQATEEIFYLNTWLHDHGYLVWTDAATVEPANEEKLGLETLARRFYQVDWTKTTAYGPTPSGNGIYIPVRGRGRESGVPRETYEAFRQQLVDALRQFADPATGEPVVTRIWTREEAFAGRYMPLAPDLTLALRDGGFVSVLPSDTPLRPRREPSGTHHPEGIFVAAGPGVRRGVSLSRLSILDIAPTLLYVLGLPIPEDLEGCVPVELFETAQARARPVLRAESTLPPEPFPTYRAEEKDAEGEAEIISRLKALGYVE